jgi:succinoglycan biosynthesis transport protein ExoP
MPDDFDLRHHLAVLRRHAILIAVTVVLVGAAAYGASRLEQTSYRSTSTVLYSAQTVNTGTGTPEDPVRVLNTLSRLVSSGAVLEAAAKRLGIPRAELDKATTVEVQPDDDLLRITATAPSPRGAERRANAITYALLAWRSENAHGLAAAQAKVLARQLADLNARGTIANASAIATVRAQLAAARAELATKASDLSLVQGALPPKQPFTPHPRRNAAVGILAGLLLGILAAFVRDRVDRRLDSVEEVEAIFGRPSLGAVPWIPAAGRGNRLAAVGDYAASTQLSEAFRTIRTNLALFRVDETSLRSIVVSSAVAGEGKSAVTANLALALASSGRRVLAVSADLRSPMLHEYFDGDDRSGLLEVLSGDVDLATGVRNIQVAGNRSPRPGRLALLANGRRFFDPAALYESAAMTELLEDAAVAFDVILFDAPPLLVSGEASVLAARADALLFVARLDRVTREEARRAARTLAAAELTPLGLIVTGRMSDKAQSYGYGYGSDEE